MFYNQINSFYNILNNKEKLLKETLSNFPSETISIRRNGKYFKWFIHNKGSTSYLNKSSKRLASTLALKQMITLQLQSVQNEKSAIQLFLNNYSKDKEFSSLIQNCSLELNNLVSHLSIISDSDNTWSCLEYPKNTNHPENLRYTSSSGHIVRSKSELLIDTLLSMKNIQFRYECELTLGDIILYPDFTIKHPSSGKCLYWEHFGMMDDDKYRNNAFSKLQLYAKNNILPSIDLITTFESKDNPLDMRTIEKPYHIIWKNNFFIQ